MTGKDKCKMLKEIRQQTAEANGIPFNTEECKFKGECKGTCPKCEAELKYINEQLERKKRLGAAAAAVVMSAGLLLSTTACTPLMGEPTVDPDYIEEDATYSDTSEDYLMGEPTVDPDYIEVLEGEEEYYPEEDCSDGSREESILQGDIPVTENEGE